MFIIPAVSRGWYVIRKVHTQATHSVIKITKLARFWYVTNSLFYPPPIPISVMRISQKYGLSTGYFYLTSAILFACLMFFMLYRTRSVWIVFSFFVLSVAPYGFS